MARLTQDPNLPSLFPTSFNPSTNSPIINGDGYDSEDGAQGFMGQGPGQYPTVQEPQLQYDAEDVGDVNRCEYESYGLKLERSRRVPKKKSGEVIKKSQRS
jgi:hypothetical protein